MSRVAHGRRRPGGRQRRAPARAAGPQTSLNELAYRGIRALIDRGEVAYGEPLSEEHLARQLHMSRTPVREALKRLAVENLVAIYPRRGTFLSMPSLADLQEIFEIREALEGAAARLATPRVSEDAIRAFQRRLDAAYRAHDGAGVSATGQDLHFFIVDAAQNQRLREYLLTLRAQIRIAFALFDRLPEQLDRAHREYKALLAAMRRRDAEAAEGAMRRHIAGVRDHIFEAMRFARPAHPAPGAERARLAPTGRFVQEGGG
jgi:DNA-binding GntR family transcriptional regulator